MLTDEAVVPVTNRLPGTVGAVVSGADAIVQLNVVLPVPPRPSLTVAVTLEVPAAVGVPVIKPDGLIDSPAGSPLAVNVIGAVPVARLVKA